jgi:hypothetical protein
MIQHLLRTLYLMLGPLAVLRRLRPRPRGWRRG